LNIYERYCTLSFWVSLYVELVDASTQTDWRGISSFSGKKHSELARKRMREAWVMRKQGVYKDGYCTQEERIAVWKAAEKMREKKIASLLR